MKKPLKSGGKVCSQVQKSLRVLINCLFVWTENSFICVAFVQWDNKQRLWSYVGFSAPFPSCNNLKLTFAFCAGGLAWWRVGGMVGWRDGALKGQLGAQSLGGKRSNLMCTLIYFTAWRRSTWVMVSCVGNKKALNYSCRRLLTDGRSGGAAAAVSLERVCLSHVSQVHTLSWAGGWI